MSFRDGGQARVSPIAPPDAKACDAWLRVSRRPEWLAQIGRE
jgi:hypothetical protein